MFQVHRPVRLRWEGGLGLAVSSQAAVLVHAGVQPGQTVQHPLQQRAPPSALPLRRHFQRGAPWEHNVHVHSQELVADDAPLHAGPTFYQVHGKWENRVFF